MLRSPERVPQILSALGPAMRAAPCRTLCRRGHICSHIYLGVITQEGAIMKMKILAVAAFVVVSLPFDAYPQGTFRGAEEGAAAGNRAAGPVGAVVGGAIGAATGTVGGILGVEERPRFRENGIRGHHPPFRYPDEGRIGAGLPERGVTLHAGPREHHQGPGYPHSIG